MGYIALCQNSYELTSILDNSGVNYIVTHSDELICDFSDLDEHNVDLDDLGEQYSAMKLETAVHYLRLGE